MTYYTLERLACGSIFNASGAHCGHLGHDDLESVRTLGQFKKLTRLWYALPPPESPTARGARPHVCSTTATVPRVPSLSSVSLGFPGVLVLVPKLERMTALQRLWYAQPAIQPIGQVDTLCEPVACRTLYALPLRRLLETELDDNALAALATVLPKLPALIEFG